MDDPKSKERIESFLKRHDEAIAAFKNKVSLADQEYRSRIKEIERHEFMMRTIVIAVVFVSTAIQLFFVAAKQKTTIKSEVFNLGENQKPSDQGNDSADHRSNERTDRVQKKQDDGSHFEE